MNGLILLSISLTALVGALCTLVYSRQADTLKRVRQQDQALAKIESLLTEVSQTQLNISRRIDQLSTDVLQREIYQTADDRHQLAIQSAKQGKGLVELIQRHGLSSDEAALILSLHSPKNANPVSGIKNANLVDPDVVDAI